MKKFLTAVLFSFIATSAYAGPNAVVAKRFKAGTGAGSAKLLDAVAINASQTMTIPLGMAYSKIEVTVDYTYSAATAVTAEVYCSVDGTVFGRRQTRSCAAGTCTTSDQLDSNAVSASETFTLEYDVSTCEAFRLVFDGTAADGSDLVDVYAVGTIR